MVRPRQWRHGCDCAPAVAEARHSNPWVRMHSQVSNRNVSYFVDAGLVPESVGKTELWQLLNRDGSVIVCNVCDAVKVVEGGQSQTVYGGGGGR